MAEHLYTWSGHYFGYRDGDDLWTYDGRHVGKFVSMDAYDQNGRYLGEIRNGFYLIRDTRKAAVTQGRFFPRDQRAETVRHIEHMGFSLPAGFEDFPKL